MTTYAIDAPDALGTTRTEKINLPGLDVHAEIMLRIIMETAKATRLPGYAESNELSEEFARLADQWHEETGHLSSPSQIAMHPAYQRIIGMGERAIPLILRDLHLRGGQWYWALRAITDQSPVPQDAAGNIRIMKQAWLHWGANRGYVA